MKKYGSFPPSTVTVKLKVSPKFPIKYEDLADSAKLAESAGEGAGVGTGVGEMVGVAPFAGELTEMSGATK